MDYRIVSIGTLSSNPHWGEKGSVRPPHATCTLIRAENKVILVDPSLPPQVLGPRLNERSGLALEAVTDVFLTNFRPAHRHGLLGLMHANWWIFDRERQAVGAHLVAKLKDAAEPELAALLKQDVALLQRCQPAPDSLAPHVDLFPLPGYTPGTCGLLLAMQSGTLIIASDAVPTIEHLARGQVLQGAFDLEQAQESFREVIEISDWIIPGHDNLTPNLLRRF